METINIPTEIKVPAHAIAQKIPKVVEKLGKRFIASKMRKNHDQILLSTSILLSCFCFEVYRLGGAASNIKCDRWHFMHKIFKISEF